MSCTLTFTSECWIFYKSFGTFPHVVLGHLETFDPFQKCFSGLFKRTRRANRFPYCCRSLLVLSLVLLRSPVWMQSSGSVWPNWVPSTVTSSPFGVVVLAQPIVVSLCTCLSSIPDVWTRPSKDPRNSFHAAFSFLLLCPLEVCLSPFSSMDRPGTLASNVATLSPLPHFSCGVGDGR